LRFFAIFEVVGPHFLSQKGEILYEGADLGLVPQAEFYKNYLRGYTLWGEKPVFRLLSKNNTGMAARRAGLPVINVDLYSALRVTHL